VLVSRWKVTVCNETNYRLGSLYRCMVRKDRKCQNKSEIQIDETSNFRFGPQMFSRDATQGGLAEADIGETTNEVDLHTKKRGSLGRKRGNGYTEETIVKSASISERTPDATRNHSRISGCLHVTSAHEGLWSQLLGCFLSPILRFFALSEPALRTSGCA
jgi:hypothetical protein